MLVNDVVNTPLFDRSTNSSTRSTVKPFIGLRGRAKCAIDYEFTIQIRVFRLPGVLRWGDYTLRTAIGGGHGETDLQKAIYQSCDTFFRSGSPPWPTPSMGFFPNLVQDNFALDVGYANRRPPETGREIGENLLIQSTPIGQGYMWATPLQLAQPPPFWPTGRGVQPRIVKAVDGEPFDR